MLKDKLKNKNIILASKSPRRQELLKKLGLEFEIKTKEVEENYSSELKKEEITNFLALKKAEPFKDYIEENDILITSDTIVWHKNKALEKPKNKNEAILMLNSISNSCHEVITSICLMTKTSEKIINDVTKVHFKKLNQEEINFYIDNYNPYDKAGSYGIQEWIGFIGIDKIEGSFFNVMGMPLHKLYKEILKL